MNRILKYGLLLNALFVICTLRAMGSIANYKDLLTYMKKIIIFILLIIHCSCTRKANNTVYETTLQQNDHQSYTKIIEDEIDIASIDTAEFIIFWKLFQKSIIKRDTTMLSTMLIDSIYGGFLLHAHKDNEYMDKFSKNILLNNLDSLFTPEFLSLLKSYEIEKYINSHQENILWKKGEKKTYKSDMRFGFSPVIPTRTTWNMAVHYTMFWRRDKEYEYYYPGKHVMRPDYHRESFNSKGHIFGFTLTFGKSSTGIKLYTVDYYFGTDICD